MRSLHYLNWPYGSHFIAKELWLPRIGEPYCASLLSMNYCQFSQKEGRPTVCPSQIEVALSPHSSHNRIVRVVSYTNFCRRNVQDHYATLRQAAGRPEFESGSR